MQGNKYEFSCDSVITAKEIKQILEDYRIGKKPLAKLLGWGETTIIRYMDGDIPTNEYSSRLRTILNDPKYYYDLLMQRRDTLTGVAYRKSIRATLDKLMETKIRGVSYYLLNRCNGETDPSFIQYLLYYIQAFSLALYDKEMFEENYIVNQGFAPYEEIYVSMSRGGMNPLEIEEDYLIMEERILIDAVYESFAWYGKKTLEVMTKEEREKMKVSTSYGKKIISKSTIKKHFKKIVKAYHINSVSDISNYPDGRFLSIRKIEA